nr:MAG TPA: Lysis protein [Caudoviricetes sp.]
MKKKIVTILLISSLALTACGSNNQVQSSSAPSTQTAEEADTQGTENDISELNAIGDIDVDKNLFDVTITVPADLVGDTTQEELDAKAADSDIHSITLNDDGSATYVMSKSQHKKMMQELADNINSTLSDMVGSEDYPNFTDIKANSDFTNFTVTTTSTELDLTDSISIMGFYMYGGMYAIFNGSDVDNIHVDFVNADSGEIINSADSSDMVADNTENQ